MKNEECALWVYEVGFALSRDRFFEIGRDGGSGVEQLSCNAAPNLR